MSKTKEAAPAVVAAPKTIRFRDKLYTSRQVILPDGASLSVVQRVAEVQSDDAQALAHMQAHPEFEPLE
jgi:hypothetical protein